MVILNEVDLEQFFYGTEQIFLQTHWAQCNTFTMFALSCQYSKPQIYLKLFKLLEFGKSRSLKIRCEEDLWRHVSSVKIHKFKTQQTQACCGNLKLQCTYTENWPLSEWGDICCSARNKNMSIFTIYNKVEGLFAQTDISEHVGRDEDSHSPTCWYGVQ